MGRQASQLFPLGYRRPALHSRNDYRLGNTRQGIFRLQGCRRSAEAADAGAYLIGNPFFLQAVHLLPDRAVQTGIARMETDYFLFFLFPLYHHIHHFLQRHQGAVVDPAMRRRRLKQLLIYQGTCINNNIRFLQKRLSSDCYQVRRSRPCPYKMNHFPFSYSCCNSAKRISAPFVFPKIP